MTTHSPNLDQEKSPPPARTGERAEGIRYKENLLAGASNCNTRFGFAGRRVPPPMSLPRGGGTRPADSWYSLHTGSKPLSIISKWNEANNIRKDRKWVEIYPSAVSISPVRDYQDGYNPPPPVDGPRGKITTFSPAAARACREALVTLHVDKKGYSFWGFTLTTKRINTPAQWRKICKRFRTECIARRWAGIYRVELQKRKAPHIHVGMWLPFGDGKIDVVLAWCRCSGELDDQDALDHSVRGHMIEQDQPGWAVYVALHSGKHKGSQLGWQGKQWGIWNKSILTKRNPLRICIEGHDHPKFLRTLRNLENAARRSAGKDSRVRSMHRGNLLRCMKGETAQKIINALRSGVIA